MVFENVASVPRFRILTPDGKGYSLHVPVLHVTSSTKPVGSIATYMNKQLFYVDNQANEFVLNM